MKKSDRKREANNAVHRQTYQKRKDAGLCTRCGKRWAETGRCKCRPCREKAQKYYADHDCKNRMYEHNRILREERREAGLCWNCGKPLAEDEIGMYTQCRKCRKKKMERTTVARIRMRIHGIKRKW